MRSLRALPISSLISLQLVLTAPAFAQEAGENSDWKIRVSPVGRYISVDGDDGKFREDWWMKQGWVGGLEEFTVKHDFKNDISLRLEGRALIPEEDYRARLDVEKEDVGFIRAGYREYRKYFDDTGGFFSPFTVSSFSLNKDLHLDIGKIYLEVGLALPAWPSILLGYERRFKEGKKSLLEWGSVTESDVTRKIFPAFKDIDETVDIYRAEIDYEIGKFRLRDLFRYEHTVIETTRVEQELDLDTGSSETVAVSEGYEHDAVYNTSHIEGRVHEKVYFSFGYLFTDLEGDAAFRMFTIPFGPEPFDKDWFTRSVDLEQDSHVLNVNAMVGPFRDVTLYGGMQAETTDSTGDTEAVLLETLPGLGAVSPEANIRSQTDKGSLEETVGVRYAGLSYTTLYAEGRWIQQDIDLHEREVEDASLLFERTTDTNVNRQRYSVGFDTSPLRRLKLSSRYRRNFREYEYDHKTDTEPGYSAFITRHEIATDELSAKVTFRLIPAVTTSVQYQLVRTEIETRSDTTPTNSVQSGDYEADIYSVSVTYIPVSSLYVTGLFSLRDTRSVSFDNGAESVVPYKGDVYLFMGTAGYAVDKKTDVNLKLLYSRSDNLTDNFAEGLPLGLDNDRLGISVDLARRLNESCKVRLQYGFYRYDEDSNGGVDDYDAHLFGVGWEYRF